jgi:hypothetical protein
MDCLLWDSRAKKTRSLSFRVLGGRNSEQGIGDIVSGAYERENP